MNKILLAIIISLIAGFAAGAWTTSASQPTERAISGTGPGDYFDPDASAAERIGALERIVAEERDARLVLEEQIQELFSDLERLDVPELHDLLRQLADKQQRPQERQEEQVVRVRRGDARRTMRDYAEARARQLVDGGFTEARAKQILQLEDQVRMDALQAEYEARRNGEVFNPWGQAYNYQATLRERLGDAEYEKYLQANGSQATITVRSVIDVSPAQRAGLRPGDRIVSYDGGRVFSMYELKSKAFAGDQGENVIVDIERDGQHMQLVLPRGPLGITGNGANMGSRYPFGG